MPTDWSKARVTKRERRTIGESVRHFVTFEVEVSDSDADLVAELRTLTVPPSPDPLDRPLRDDGHTFVVSEPKATPPRRRR